MDVVYQCKRCSHLLDIYPEGITFRKEHRKRGVVPCLCSKSPKLSDRQKVALIKRYFTGTPLELLDSYKEGTAFYIKFFLKSNGAEGVKKFSGEEGLHSFISARLQLNTRPVTDFDFLPKGSYFYKAFPESKNELYRYRCGRCSNGVADLFPLRRGNIIAKKLTCRCNPNYKPTLEERLMEIKSLLSETGCVFRGWASKDQTVKGKFDVCCPQGHSFTTNLDNLKHKKRHCPSCSDFTFKVDKSDCVFYIHSFGKWGKYGITSREHKIRLYEQSTCNVVKGKVIATYRGVGSIIKRLEDEVKVAFKSISKATKNELPDGYTESFELNTYNLNKIYHIINHTEGLEKGEE